MSKPNDVTKGELPEGEEVKRKRIITGVPPTSVPAIIDDNLFIANRCTNHAKKICSIDVRHIFEMWYDQHYIYRHQVGDENGKRIGIDTHIVEALVRKSVKHLAVYSSCVKNFTFINTQPGIGATRIILRELLADTTLHVVIEVHLISINQFEITVKTAMCEDHFKIAAGSYCLEFDGDNSILFKMDNGALVKVFEL